jgi:23S rRNA pseudouridine1911/1915/1917 synthase
MSPNQLRLDAALVARGMRPAEVRAALESGKVYLDGAPTGDGGRWVNPERVELRPQAPRLVPGRDLFLLHRDQDLVVIIKPAGMLAVPAPRPGGHRSAVGRVIQLCGTGLPVHRIDEETSGLLVVALHEQAQAALKADLERHDMERRYLALASGSLGGEERRIESTLVRDRGDGLRGSSEEGDGRRAVTWLRGLEPLAGATLVEARLETGRTHQVRIHLAESGHPILGDPLYANTGAARASQRLALHAAVLGFRHPRSGERLRFEIPLADDLERLRRRLAHDHASRREAPRGRPSR